MKKTTKDKVNKFVKGSISIFLAFLLTGVLSLGALLVEGSRYQQAKKQLEESSITSALSLLAFYDTDLEKRFGLYGIDSETTSADAFLNYLLFNSDCTEDGVYSANNISQLYNVTSGSYELKYDLANYQVLKRQILEYEKYRAPLNMASEMLDIDKMIKELKKNIEKAIPGLEKMLDVCESVAEIAEAIKALYCLYKDVQQLQMTIGGADTLGDMSNQFFGQAWEAVEGLFSDEEWPSHDPTYEEAYTAFQNAVNAKVQYMKTTPVPPDPGPKPTDDVDGLYSTYQTALKKYETASLMLEMLEAAEELGYFDDKGLVNANSKVEDLLDKDIIEDELKKFDLTKNSTRDQFVTAINNKVTSVMSSGNKLTTFKDTDIEGLITALETTVPTLQTDMQSKYNSYSVANAKLTEWNRKNNAVIQYNQNISNYNQTINTTKADLVTVIGVITEELGSYKGSLESVTEALDKADAALKAIEENNGEDEDVDPDIFSEIKSNFITPEIQKPDSGITFLNAQKEKLNNLSADDIDASYNFGSNFNKGQLFVDGAYFMSKSAATGFCGMLAGLYVLEGMSEIINILKAMWKLVSLLQPFPSTYEWDCVVELNPSTTNILPSRINGGAGTNESPNGDDIADISAMLNDAKNTLGSAHTGDINSVDPNIRIPEAELSNEIASRITNLSNNLSKLMGSSTTASLVSNPVWPFIATIFKLLELIPTMVEIVYDLIYVAQHFEEAIQIMISSLGENLLLNQYIIDEFPNRTSDKDGNKFNNEIGGYSGDKRQYFPDNTKPVQTFSGAQVEYVIGGSYSEKANQQNCFWSIFAIRAINNIFGVLTDSTAMELIGACNIAAPLVFILWVYLESNIDMNMLVSRMEVPLIKTEIILSPNTLMSNIEQICSAFEDIDEEEAIEEELSYAGMKIDNVTKQLLTTDGMFKMKYDNYLWFFLFFTPNQTKVMRVADLMQMEMRFAKQSKGTNFQLQNLHTYVRCEAEGTFNSILPVISLSDNSLNGRGFKVSCVKYVGY